MHQTLSERKRELLTRAAESRVSVVESMEATAGTMLSVYGRFRVLSSYVKVGLGVGAGLVGMLLMKRMLSVGRRRVSTALQVPTVPARSAGGALLLLAVQLASALLLPWVRERVHGTDFGQVFKRMQPSHIFFRWLGLEK